MHMGKDTELLLHVRSHYTSLRIMHIKVLYHNNQGRERSRAGCGIYSYTRIDCLASTSTDTNNAGDDSLQLGNSSSPGGGHKPKLIAQEGSSGGVDRVTDGARTERATDRDHDTSRAYPRSASAVEQRDGSKGLRKDT